MKGRGEVTTSRINRRALLFHSGAAVFASTVAETGRAPEPPHQFRVPPNTLRALIEAHMTAYVGFVRAVHEMGGSSGDCDRASREEDKVLLAVCAYPAVSDGDRFAKAQYLLEIEARGELDLPTVHAGSSSLDDVEDIRLAAPVSAPVHSKLAVSLAVARRSFTGLRFAPHCSPSRPPPLLSKSRHHK